MRPYLAICAICLLSACGGGGRGTGASGEIAQACLAADRAAASPALCGCVQQAANQTLTAADRRRVPEFFADPEEAHAMKIDDSPYAEAFWDRYRAFIDLSRSMCG